MDALQYVAGKAKGQAGIILHGESTLLVSTPGGFNPQTGDSLPPIERGYQRADLEAMRDAALQAHETAREALIAAGDVVLAWDQVLLDADAVLPAAPK